MKSTPTILEIWAAAVAVLTGLVRTVVAGPVLYGLGFSPFVDGQGPGTYIPPAQIEGRLSLVAEHTRFVRTWGSRYGLEYIPTAAGAHGIGVAQCAYLDANPADNEQEKANLVAAAAGGNVPWAIVGTEALVSNKVTEGGLLGHLDNVRTRLDEAGLAHVAVATAEPYGNWANAQPGGLFHRNVNGDLLHAEVFRHVDVLMVHLYPFHEGVGIDAAVATLATMYAEASSAAHSVVPDLPVVIGETGWPTDGFDNGQAVPSVENQERYFREVTAWAAQEDVSVFWFQAFDENWKPDGYAGVEKHWGLWDAAATPKFPIPEPVSLVLLAPGAVCLLRRRPNAAVTVRAPQ